MKSKTYFLVLNFCIVFFYFFFLNSDFLFKYQYFLVKIYHFLCFKISFYEILKMLFILSFSEIIFFYICYLFVNYYVSTPKIYKVITFICVPAIVIVMNIYLYGYEQSLTCESRYIAPFLPISIPIK